MKNTCQIHGDIDDTRRRDLMKVLFISSDNNKASGAFLSLVQLCKELKAQFNVDSCIVLSEKGDGEDILQIEGIPFRMIRSFHWIESSDRIKKNPLRHIKWAVKFLYNIIPQRKIMSLIDEINPNLVHINTTYSYVAAKPAIKKKVPLVWHLREYLEEGQGLQIIYKDYGFKMISNADAIICVSKGLKKKYENLLKGRIECIYNGIDETRFTSIDKEIFKDEEIHCLSIGGLYPEKGQTTLIEACRMLKENNIFNFCLEIVGRGEERNNIQRVIREYGLESNIRVCGYTETPEDYYSKADIVIVTSKEEAFGRVLVEAMMSGCLVISSSFNAAREIIGNEEFGLLFEYNNSAKLYEKIRYAFENKTKMREIAGLSRGIATNNYTSKKNAQHIYDCYRRIMAHENR